MGDETARTGRPTKLTPELADAIVAAVQAGNSIKGSAAIAGIHRATLHDWLAKGESDDAEPEFRDLYDRVEAARAQVIGSLYNAAYMDAIGGVEIERGQKSDGTEYTKVTPPNGKVALELMARMAPDEWRPVKAVEVSGPNGGPMEMTGNVAVVEGLLDRISKARDRREVEAARAVEARRAAAAANAYGGDEPKQARS